MVSQKSTIQTYEKNINKVITYISNNVGKEFTLDELARESYFSKYHFSRIFKSITGENVSDFIRRIRLEKAAFQLIFNMEISITDIALEFGFSSSQNFAKAFKLHFGCTPREYRNNENNKIMSPFSNLGNINGNQVKELSHPLSYTDIVSGVTFKINLKVGEMGNVEIKRLSDRNVAYIRRTSNYTPKEIGESIGKLVQWAVPRDLIKTDNPIFCAFWDNVAVTPDDKRRFDVCIQIPKDYKVGGVIHHQVIRGGKFAVYSCQIEDASNPGEFYTHWNSFLGEWFPISGYQPADGPCFEVLYNILEIDSCKSLKMDICIPVKEL